MTDQPMARDRGVGAAAVALASIVLLALVACSDPAPRASSTSGATLTVRTVPAAEPAAPAENAACAQAQDRTVRLLPDVTVPAIVVEELADSGGGAVPGFTVPEQVIDGGCVIEYAAPGGCVGAVEITPVQIPPLTVPETVVPAARMPGGRALPEKRFPAITVPGRTLQGARTEQVCREEVNGELPSVTRQGVVREGGSRNGAVRPGGKRPATCQDDTCVGEVVVPSIRLEPVRVDDVDIDPVRLTRERVADSVDVIQGDDRRSYVAAGDVLFATDEATLRPAARDALQTIADLVRPTTGAVTIEGHTDDRSGAQYNLKLSERRARAVAAWLASRGGVPQDRLVVVARGESAPAVPNDSAAHRQANRRVVVTVKTD